MTDPGGDIVIRGATVDDLDVLADIISHALHPMKLSRWLVPDEFERARVFPAYFRIFVQHALEHGIVHTTTDRAGVAVWLPRTAQPEPEIPDYQQRLQQACGPRTPFFQRLDRAMEIAHPTWRPYHHLAFLAVFPNRQRRGIGSALLAHHHGWLDEQKMPAYLQAGSPEARDFYLRFPGYHTTGLRPVNVDAYHPMYPAWRDPRHRNALQQHAGGSISSPPPAPPLRPPPLPSHWIP